jgi:hypothetical protein
MAEPVQFWNTNNLIFINDLRDYHSRSLQLLRSSTQLVFRNDPTRSKWRSKPGLPLQLKEPPLATYSNLKISTGKSREASRAGTIVATIEMTIAAAAIHSPSKMLGKNGT